MPDKILIIWNEGDKISLYLIPQDVVDQYRDHVFSAHNHYVNAASENDGCVFLNLALTLPESVAETIEGMTEQETEKFGTDHVGLFHQYLIADDQDSTANHYKVATDNDIANIVISGFMP